MKPTGIIIFIICVVLLMAGGGYYYYSRPTATNPTTDTKAPLNSYVGWFWWGDGDTKDVVLNRENIVPASYWVEVNSASASAMDYPSPLLDDGTIKIPVTGLYSLSFNYGTRAVDTKSPNAWWSIRSSAAYEYTTPPNLWNGNLSMQSGNTANSVFIGYLEKDDIVAPVVFTDQWFNDPASTKPKWANTTADHRKNMSVVLIYPTEKLT